MVELGLVEPLDEDQALRSALDSMIETGSLDGGTAKLVPMAR